MAEGPIATRIWIADGQPFALAGGVKAPDPQVMQDPALGMEVELYEGEAAFTLPVKIAAALRPAPTRSWSVPVINPAMTKSACRQRR